MSAAGNKRLMQGIFAGLAKGDGRPFRDSLAENIRWTLAGTTKWSKTYEGTPAVIDELLRPLFAQFADQYTNSAHRFIAEGEYVVVECQVASTPSRASPITTAIAGYTGLPTASLRS